jgi:glutathione-regulated potassium-efflux system ancillary protein KefG
MNKMTMPKILWNLFHENFAASRGNKALLAGVAGLREVTIRNLYELYPTFKIDVGAEQALLRQNDVVVLQHPFYWYSIPALMKEWQDKVLTFGFAYPPKEGTALHGKKWLSVITTGGPQWSYRSGGYNNYTMSELLRPLQQTAYLCGMDWLPPFVVHGVLPGDYEEIKATRDSELEARAKELRAFVESIDMHRRRSLEPLVAPHYLKAVEREAGPYGSPGAGSPSGQP